jgi:transcriptional regulator with XRE-family HTH domain
MRTELYHPYDPTRLGTWLKAKRLEKQYSQESIAKGLCSVSHLSYYENGKRKLDEEIVIEILKRLEIKDIDIDDTLGHIRQQFYNLFQQIVTLDYEAARQSYAIIKEHEATIKLSPYVIAYDIHVLIYKTFVESCSYHELKDLITPLEKIVMQLEDELKQPLLFVLGKQYYKYTMPQEGIKYLRMAREIKKTPYIEYHLGFMYGFENQPIKGVYHMEIALSSYEDSGHYINAMWCNNYLGIFTTHLGDYQRAYKHYSSALTAATYFDMTLIKHHLYINLSHLHTNTKEYNKAKEYCQLALSLEYDPILPAINLIDVLKLLGQEDEVKKIFNKYMAETYQTSRYMPFMSFLYLDTFKKHTEEYEKKVTKEILPYYENLHYVEIIKTIRLGLIDYYEGNRSYKKANHHYKAILNMV